MNATQPAPAHTQDRREPSIVTMKRSGHYRVASLPTSCSIAALLCSASLLAFFQGGRALGQTPSTSTSSEAWPAQWTVKVGFSWQCLYRNCASFYPAGHPEPIPLSAVLAFDVKESGQLVILAGQVQVIGKVDGAEESLTFRQGVVNLTPEGPVAVSPIVGRGRTKHAVSTQASTSAPASQFRVGLSPLKAGPEGTQYRFVSNRQGTVLLWVLEGAVRVTWYDTVSGPGELFRAGEAAYVTLEGTQTHTLRRLSGREATREFQALEEGMSLVGTKGIDTVEGAYADLIDSFSQGAAAQPAEKARALAARFPQEPLAARGLYQAWLSAEGRGEIGQAAELARVLKRDFSDSAWAAFLPAETAQSDGTTEDPAPPEAAGSEVRVAPATDPAP